MADKCAFCYEENELWEHVWPKVCKGFGDYKNKCYKAIGMGFNAGCYASKEKALEYGIYSPKLEMLKYGCALEELARLDPGTDWDQRLFVMAVDKLYEG